MEAWIDALSSLNTFECEPRLLTSMRTGCWSPPRKWAPLRTSGRKRPLSGTQHNFHETNRETLKRARPQVVTSRDNRLTDTSARWKRRGVRERERVSVNSKHSSARKKYTGKDKPGSPGRTDCVYSEC